MLASYLRDNETTDAPSNPARVHRPGLPVNYEPRCNAVEIERSVRGGKIKGNGRVGCNAEEGREGVETVGVGSPEDVERDCRGWSQIT